MSFKDGQKHFSFKKVSDNPESWGISFDLPNYIILYVHIFVKGVQEQLAKTWPSNQRCEMQIEWQVSAGSDPGNGNNPPYTCQELQRGRDEDPSSRMRDDPALRWVMALSDNQPDATKKRNTPPMWSFMCPEKLRRARWKQRSLSQLCGWEINDTGRSWMAGISSGPR